MSAVEDGGVNIPGAVLREENSEAEADALGKIFPSPEAFVVNGEEITVHKIKMKDVPRVMGAVRPILPYFHASDKPKMDLLMEALTENYEHVVQLIALLVGKDPEWVMELDLDDAVDVFARSLEVNLDFFIQRILPSLLSSVNRLSVAMAVKETKPTFGPRQSKP